MSRYISFNTLWNKIKGLLGPVTSINDYVVESGKSNSGSSSYWTWKKWNSGKAEYWGTFSESFSVTTSWGEVYENSNYTNKSFPSGLFNTTPIYCEILFQPNVGTYWLASMELGTGLSSTHTQNYALTRANNGGTLTGWTTIHAFGTWK